MPRESVQLRGRFTAVARDANGRITDIRHVENLVVNGGLQWLAGVLAGTQTSWSSMKYLGIGEGSTSATATNTALGSEVESRITGTQSTVTTDSADDTYRCVGTFTMTGTRALQEAGLFSATTSGTMMCRQTFSTINLGSGATLQITWNIDMDAS